MSIQVPSSKCQVPTAARKIVPAMMTVFICGTSLFAAPSGASDEIPALRPPRGEIPPTFGERYGGWLVVATVLLAAAAFVTIRWLLRQKPTVVLPPEIVARTELAALRGQPETGAVLSRVSQAVRHYFAAAFRLAPGELTTTEFCRELAGQNQITPELSARVGDFLRQCDERKFAPVAPPAGNAAAEALNLVELAEARRAEPGSATGVVNPAKSSA